MTPARRWGHQSGRGGGQGAGWAAENDGGGGSGATTGCHDTPGASWRMTVGLLPSIVMMPRCGARLVPVPVEATNEAEIRVPSGDHSGAASQPSPRSSRRRSSVPSESTIQMRAVQGRSSMYSDGSTCGGTRRAARPVTISGCSPLRRDTRTRNRPAPMATISPAWETNASFVPSGDHWIGRPDIGQVAVVVPIRRAVRPPARAATGPDVDDVVTDRTSRIVLPLRRSSSRPATRLHGRCRCPKPAVWSPVPSPPWPR